ncbi:MAG: DegT/DnrJ/EryC1/StrS family aminotransferase [Candidatus Hydrogenedentes bacterium]|nr:DegT/DnrJ/EryC1/StrS family aminotransferase [Candidatus Hydrogenedentota bacterium]
MIPFGELNSQFKSIEAEIRAAIDDVLSAGRFIFGKQCEAFESEFAAYVGAQHVAGVNSGTDAIHLALRAVGVGPGDEVITAANTCVPTVAGICASGARPVPADIDPATCTIDPGKLEAAITPRTKAIVPVHLYGHPCNMPEICAVAAAHRVAVVEDCAQAHGAGIVEGGRLRKCGTFGAASAFSFYPSKNLGAYGDAGAVVTNDGEVDARVRMLRNYGEERRYYHSSEGFNSRLDELQAAILRVKLRHLEEWNEARRERAGLYAERLKRLPIRLPFEADWARHIYHLYVIRSRRRDALQAHLDARGIGTLLHYPVPIHLQKAYAHLGYAPGDFPESERACSEVLSLPMYAEMPVEHIEAVARAIGEFHEPAPARPRTTS